MSGNITLSVEQAAETLGVSGARVRAMLAAGQLEGEKVGRAWVVSAASVRRRLREGSHPGRPSKKPQAFTRAFPDVEEAHQVYDDARRVLSGCYSAEFLNQARNADEQAFWLIAADFFLQCEQRKLIAEGAY